MSGVFVITVEVDVFGLDLLDHVRSRGSSGQDRQELVAQHLVGLERLVSKGTQVPQLDIRFGQEDLKLFQNTGLNARLIRISRPNLKVDDSKVLVYSGLTTPCRLFYLQQDPFEIHSLAVLAVDMPAQGQRLLWAQNVQYHLLEIFVTNGDSVKLFVGHYRIQLTLDNRLEEIH